MQISWNKFQLTGMSTPQAAENSNAWSQRIWYEDPAAKCELHTCRLHNLKALLLCESTAPVWQDNTHSLALWHVVELGAPTDSVEKKHKEHHTCVYVQQAFIGQGNQHRAVQKPGVPGLLTCTLSRPTPQHSGLLRPSTHAERFDQESFKDHSN